MPLAPAKADSISLSKYHFATAPTDTNTVNPSPAVRANDTTLESEGVWRGFVLSPANSAKECMGC